MTETKICTFCKEEKSISEFGMISRTGKREARCGACRKIYAAAYRKKVAASPMLTQKRKEVLKNWYRAQRVDSQRWAVVMEQQREKRKRLWRTDPHYRTVTLAKNKRARLRRMQDEVAHTRYLEKLRAKTQELKDIVYKFYGNQCTCCSEKERAFLVMDHVKNNGAIHRKVGKAGIAFYRLVIQEGFPADYQILCCNCNWGRFINGGICPHQSPKGSEAISQESTPKQVEAPSFAIDIANDDMVRSA